MRKSGPFVKPSSSKVATKPAKDKAVTCAMSLAINAPKKRRSRGRGRLIKGLSPHVNPPPVSAPSTSMSVPAVQSAVFGSTDARPQYRQAALARSLQHQQSGAVEQPSSPVREKQRKLPPSKPGQGDLQDRLSRGHNWQMSQGGSKASSQAKSKGTKPKDRGGVGWSGGSLSSSHHKRTNQGHQQSSSKLGPPRPAPSATVTSGALVATSGCGGASGHSCQSKRQPKERDESEDQKVRYLFCWSIENYHLSVCLIPCEG